MKVVPIGSFTYTNNNAFGLLHRIQSKLQLHNWHDRCIDMSWTIPWLATSSEKRRMTQTVIASSNRMNEDSIFGIVEERGAHGIGDRVDNGEDRGGMMVERATLSIERSAALTDTSYGTLGVLHSFSCFMQRV